jgi:putative flippase GtrA
MNSIAQWINMALRYCHRPVKKWLPFEVFAYLATGGFNTLLNIGLFIVSYQIFAPAPLAVETATTISFGISVITGFWLNKHFAFTNASNKKKDIQKQFGKYALVALQGQLSDYLITKGLILCLSFTAQAAYILSTVIMLIVNYFLQKHFTFKARAMHN